MPKKHAFVFHFEDVVTFGKGYDGACPPSCACCTGQQHPGERGGSSVPSCPDSILVTAGGHGAGEKASASGSLLQNLRRATAMRRAP